MKLYQRVISTGAGIQAQMHISVHAKTTKVKEKQSFGELIFVQLWLSSGLDIIQSVVRPTTFFAPQPYLLNCLCHIIFKLS